MYSLQDLHHTKLKRKQAGTETGTRAMMGVHLLQSFLVGRLDVIQRAVVQCWTQGARAFDQKRIIPGHDHHLIIEHERGVNYETLVWSFVDMPVAHAKHFLHERNVLNGASRALLHAVMQVGLWLPSTSLAARMWSLSQENAWCANLIRQVSRL